MRHALIALSILLGSASPAFAQLSINFEVPGANIGINVPAYPQLQRVPGYPVYYAPGMNSNYFFYDGMYWVYEADNWYASSWYNGPWGLVDPNDVPVFVLRVPVRYYRQAPVYFHGWSANDAPRWGDHWGQTWEKRRSGWDQWNHSSAPAPAPLPTYQRQYSGSRYPQPSQQATLQTSNYRYQPKDAVAQQHFQQMRTQSSAATPTKAAPQQQAPKQQQSQRTQQQQQSSQPQQAPAREQQAASQPPQHAAQPKQAEHKPQQAPVHEQQASKQPPQHTARPEQAERKPQPAPAAHEQQASKQQPQQAERKPQPALAAREQQEPRQHSQEKAPQGKEQDNKEK